MRKTAVRIFEAIEAKESIVIYSDYDCDGIPGGVILREFFKKIGYENFTNYIPHRHDEGYGLNPEAIEKFASDGVKLLLTVDLGIGDLEDIALAQTKGIDVIVTDHHLPRQSSERTSAGLLKEELPRAFAVVNPKLGSYPEPMLCGAGVVFKLVQ